MRTVLLVALPLALSFGGCTSKKNAPPPAEVNRDPYRDVTPAKIKQKIEQTQQKEDERNDRVLEQAR